MNGQMKGTGKELGENGEHGLREKARKTENERERGRRKSTGTCKKNRRGKRREGGPVGDRLRKEGRLDKNWQNRGKKEKKQNSRMRRNWTSRQT